MVGNSDANKDMARLIAMAAKHFKVDVPIVAYREEGGNVVVTLLGGRELRCKLHDLMVTPEGTIPPIKPPKPEKHENERPPRKPVKPVRKDGTKPV